MSWPLKLFSPSTPSAIVSTPVGKRIFTNDSLLRMRMYLYRPILGSPHFWQTDKALVDWSTIRQRPKLACRGGVDNTGASGLRSELVK